MGSITSGIGLVSGIDTASLIEQLLAIESRGKLSLQRRVGVLQSQQTALLDINARLLNLQSASAAFRSDDIFGSASATSSNESSLTATARAGAVPGSYSFLVDRLVTSSQQLSRGFADADTSDIGLDQMTFEFGRGRLESTTDLADLNGGDGVRRGKIRITDATGASTVVDLSRVGEIGEVVEAINEADGVNISAKISGDGITIEDTSGGGGSLTIANVAGDFTATDLGIAGSDGGSGTLTGQSINTISGQTSLNRLNDGNGVQINSGLGNTDFTITDRAGNTHNIVLGQYDNNGEIENAASTIQDVIDRIALITDGDVTASVASDGVSLELIDNTGGAGTFSVAGAGTNGDQTALDLGILNSGVSASTIGGERILAAMDSVLVKNLNGGSGLFGTDGELSGSTPISAFFNSAGLTTNGNPSSPDLQVQDRTGATYDIELDGLNTAQDLIDAFNTATGGAVTLEIDGDNFVAVNTTTGLSNFQISDVNGSSAASELGIAIISPPLGTDRAEGNTVNPLVSRNITITDRNGGQATIDLSSAESVSDIMTLINDSGIGIQASLNEAGNGLAITDTTGGSQNLIITGGAAGALGLDTGSAGVAKESVKGSNLQLQYVTGSSRLDDLNYGRGIGNGTFRIVDANGEAAEVNIGSDANTLQDIIAEINSKGLDVLARVNDQGDGLIIEDTSTSGSLALRVETVSGTTARDLGILGEAADSGANNFIDGSYERTVNFEEGATLNDIISTIADSGIPVSATIINTGTGSTPFRLSFTSEITGANGELSIDAGDFDLGLSTIATGHDARVFFGSSDPADAVLIESSSNTLDGVIPNVNIDLISASESTTTVSVRQDTEAIIEAVNRFVTNFNDVVGRLDTYDSYNAETEERGVLLGDPTVARVRDQLYRTVQKRAIGVDDQYQYLSQVGIRIGTGGELTFDETKFREALDDDFEAVANLFTAFDKESVEEELTGGITTNNTTDTFNSLGIAEQMDQLMERLTNSVDGTLTRADDNFETLIGLTNDRIDRFDLRLEAKRTQLERQFLAMENALSQLQNQQGALGQLQSAALTASLSGVQRQ